MISEEWRVTRMGLSITVTNRILHKNPHRIISDFHVSISRKRGHLLSNL